MLGHERYVSHADRAIAAGALLALHFMQFPDRAAVYRANIKNVTFAGVAGVGLALLGEQEIVLKALRRATHSLAKERLSRALAYGATAPPPAVMRRAASSNHASTRAVGIQLLMQAGRYKDARRYALSSCQGTRVIRGSLEIAIIAALGHAGDRQAVQALFAITPKMTPAGIRLLQTELKPSKKSGVVALYAKMLTEGTPQARAVAATMLGRTGDIPALAARAPVETDPTVLEAIAGALLEHGGESSITVMLAMARRADVEIRSVALRALAGLGGDRPERFLAQMLTTGSWEDRIFLLTWSRKKHLQAILANLKHDVWQVRHATARALGRLRLRGSVEPLIGSLKTERYKRVRAAIGEALFRATGQLLGEFGDAWARWWADHGATFKVPPEVPKRPLLRRGHTTAAFYGLPLDSGRIVFLIDRSASMKAMDHHTGKTRLQTAVAETLAAVNRLKPDDMVNIILLAAEADAWRGSLVAMTKSNRTDLGTYLGARQSGGGTNLWSGLKRALTHEGVDSIFLLSDGEPSLGEFTEMRDILRETEKLNRLRRITIHCISVGRDSRLLKRLAADTGGRYVRRG